MSEAVTQLLAATEASAAPATTEETKVASPTTTVTADEALQTVEGQQAPPETLATPETTVDEEPNLEETPETSGDFGKYKELFGEHPELRHIIGREKAFSELGPFSEVREIVQRIPSIEDAQVLVDQAQNLKVLSDTLRTSPSEFAERLAEIDPNAYQKLIEHVTSDEVLQQVAPQVLQARVEHTNNRIIEATWNWVKEHGTDEEKQAVQIFARLRGYRPTAATPAPQQNSEVEKLRQKLQEREKSDSDAAFNNFWNETDNAIINTTVADIQTAIKKAFPDVTPEQLEPMTVEAWNKVRQAVGSQPQTAAQIEKFRADARKGKLGIAEHKAIQDYLLPRNRRQVPLTVKEVVSRWTKDILRVNHTQIEKKKGVADRSKDVGVGVNGSTSAAATPAQPKKPGLKGVWDRLDGEVAKMRSGATR